MKAIITYKFGQSFLFVFLGSNSNLLAISLPNSTANNLNTSMKPTAHRESIQPPAHRDPESPGGDHESEVPPPLRLINPEIYARLPLTMSASMYTPDSPVYTGSGGVPRSFSSGPFLYGSVRGHQLPSENEVWNIYLLIKFIL